LADGKKVAATDVQRASEAAGLSWRTVATAKADLGVLSERGKGDDNQWYWVLR